MKFNKEKLKQDITHGWKYHKSSTIFYITILIMVLATVFTSAEILKAKIALPNYLLSGLIILLLGSNFYLIMEKQGQIIYTEEEKKELKPDRDVL